MHNRPSVYPIFVGSYEGNVNIPNYNYAGNNSTGVSAAVNSSIKQDRGKSFNSTPSGIKAALKTYYESNH